jgi:hypothetical protein
MIIDPTDFNDRPYKVPNQEESRDFISFIDLTEEQLATGSNPDLGCSLLGQELWDEFKLALESSGPLEEKWEKLRDGEIYEYQNKQYHYKGWVDMIRPGIFSEWIPNLTYKLTNIGYVENSAPQVSKLIEDQYPFQVQHWNKFVSKVGYSYPYGYNYKNSFYGFMKVNIADYPSWVFKCPRYKNRFDL